MANLNSIELYGDYYYSIEFAEHNIISVFQQLQRQCETNTQEK